MAGSGTSKRWQLILGLAVSAACLWWAMKDLVQDEATRAQLAAAFTGANYWWLFPYWGLMVGFYWLKAWRWQILLRPVGHFPLVRSLVPPMIIGFAFNNLLPAHLGEFVRVFAFARSSGLPRITVLSSVVLERVFDVMAVLVFFGLGVIFVPQLDPGLHRTAMVFGVAAAGCIAGGLLYVLWTQPMLRLTDAILRRIPLFPAAVREKVIDMLTTGAQGLAALKSPAALAGVGWTSLVQWMFNGLMAHVSLMAFGIEAPLAASSLLLAVIAFGVTVPSSPGYFGVIQLLFLSVMGLFTNDKAAVFGASVFFQLGQYIPVTLLGLYYFNTSGLHVDEVQQKADQEADSTSVDGQATTQTAT